MQYMLGKKELVVVNISLEKLYNAKRKKLTANYVTWQQVSKMNEYESVSKNGRDSPHQGRLCGQIAQLLKNNTSQPHKDLGDFLIHDI